MIYNRLKYLSLFVAETPEEIDKLVGVFPKLESVRQDINEYLERPKEVLNMFSEALRILDKNTAELMVDRMNGEIERLKGVKDELESANSELEDKNNALEAEIARLKAQLAKQN